MRNFYMTADIDGRQTRLTGGPARKDGGMSIEIRQRDNGSSVVAFRVQCTERDGQLVTTIINHAGRIIEAFVTDR